MTEKRQEAGADPLKAILDELFLYARDYFIGVDWPLPDYNAALESDGRLKVTVGGQSILGAFCAWHEFSGRFWAKEIERRLGVSLGGFMALEEGPPEGRRPHDLKKEVRTRLMPLSLRAADLLIAAGHQNAAYDILLSLKLNFVGFFQEPDGFDPALKARLSKPQRIFDRDRVSVRHGLESLSKILGDPDSDFDLRQTAWEKAHGFLDYYSDRDPLKLDQVLGPIFQKTFDPALRLIHPLEKQMALRALNQLAYDLWSEQAYAEAIPHLQILCAEGVGLSENDFRLAECYLAEERPTEAKPHLDRLRALAPIASWMPVDSNFFFIGDAEDARAIALSRAAHALTLKRQGADICSFRKIKKTKKDKNPDSEADARRVGLIRSYFALAHDIIAPRAQDELSRRGPDSKNSAAFRADHFYHRGFFHEQIGAWDKAEADYKQAQEFDLAFGLNWNNQRFDEACTRIAQKRASQDAAIT